MNFVFILIFCLILAVYGLMNYYIGFRLWQSVLSYIPFLHPVVYWIIFFLIAFAFVIGRMGGAHLPGVVSHWLSIAGAYWMGAMVYFLLILVLIDLLRFIGFFLKLLPGRYSSGVWNYPVTGAIVLVIVTGIVLYGMYNARNPQISHYDVNIGKSANGLENLHIVMVSDIHIGNIVGKDRVEKMVEMVNGQKPDIILFAGDIIDEDIEPFIKQGIGESFRKLNAKHGVFAAFGNHEYYRGQIDTIEEQMKQANIKVLRDSCIKIDDSFYLVGREDRDSKRVLGRERKSLEDILEGTDSTLPVIVIDHTPVNLQEAEKAGADLQVSGHTHRGQLFPNQLITKRIYEVDWGYLKKGGLNVIVSSGFGTWGAPMRTGNSAEIVDITVNFKK